MHGERSISSGCWRRYVSVAEMYLGARIASGCNLPNLEPSRHEFIQSFGTRVRWLAALSKIAPRTAAASSSDSARKWE